MIPLPPEVRVVPEGLDATRFVLPKRTFGGARWPLGGVLLGAGLFATLFMVFWMQGPIRSGLEGHGLGRWLGLGFGLLGLPGLLVGIGLLLAGMAVLRGRSHAEILVTKDRIKLCERLGPARWTWQRPSAGVARVVLQKGLGTTSTNGGPAQSFGEGFGSLILEWSGAIKPLLLAFGYRYDLLPPLADELARRLSAVADVRDLALRPAIGVVERQTGGEGEDAPVPRPEGTDIAVEEHPSGIAIAVPASGLWKGSRGLFGFALAWNAFVGFMLVLVLAGTLKGKAGGPGWAMPLFLLPFLGIGVGLMAGAVSMGKRRVMLAVSGERLAYRSIGPFGTKERLVTRAQVRGVTVGPSGMEINDRPVYELQILLTGRPSKIGLLAQRTRAEQEWVAWVLRKALRVGVGRA